ncbi:MAG: hypothetical protein M2R45_00425 [Verrucomicrobia subdivision 3 bacterium]|nr:hypothetical protein [Limisphaerales bacterium]MCS1413695.1 hypothetical protein [Limisphaerales bacterium]
MSRVSVSFNVTARLMARKCHCLFLQPIPPADLQCDRAFDGAEIGSFPNSNRHGDEAFNVTARLMARKSDGGERLANGERSLQCDRAFDGAEIFSVSKMPSQKVSLQCDRAFDGAEIKRALGGFHAKGYLQCDRAFDGAEIRKVGIPALTDAPFNVTARLMARKLCFYGRGCGAPDPSM